MRMIYGMIQRFWDMTIFIFNQSQTSEKLNHKKLQKKKKIIFKLLHFKL